MGSSSLILTPLFVSQAGFGKVNLLARNEKTTYLIDI